VRRGFLGIYADWDCERSFQLPLICTQIVGSLGQIFTPQ
jgi:hypothetical protein